MPPMLGTTPGEGVFRYLDRWGMSAIEAGFRGRGGEGDHATAQDRGQR